MPALIEVGVRQLDGPAPPAQHGPGLQAAVLGTVRRADPELAEWLHDDAAPRPYGLGPLREEAGTSLFSVGWTDDSQVVAFVEALSASSCLRVGRSALELDRIDVQPIPWETLAQAPAVSRWHLELRTPLVVRAPSRDVGVRITHPLPTPQMLVQRLASRWERVGGPRLPADPERWAPCLAVSAFRLESAPWLVRAPRTYEIGAVGSLQLDLRGRRTGDAAASLGALLRFGELVGVGDHTTKGMGRVVATPREREASPDVVWAREPDSNDGGGS